MFVDKQLKRLSVIAYSEDLDSFRNILFNLCRQTIFKEGRLEIIFLIENISSEVINSYLKWIEPNTFVVNNISHNFQTALQQALNDATGRYLSFFGKDISLRPDAFMLLSQYLDFYPDCDAVHANEIISFDKTQIFESCDSRISLVLNKLTFGKDLNTLPKVFMFRNDVKNFTSSPTFDELVIKFWESIIVTGGRIEKYDSILGMRYLNLGEMEQNNITELEQKAIFDKVKNLFGSENVKLLSNVELNNLPYHFTNPFNDFVTIVLLNPEKTTEEELKQTLTSLNFLNHSNIEIVRHNGNFSFPEENRVKNILFSISAGKFILPIYAGEEVAPSFLSLALQFLKDRASSYYVYADSYQRENDTIIKNLDYSFDKLKKFNYIPRSIILPRDIFVKYGIFDEELHPKYSFWEFLIRIGSKGIQGYRIAQPLMNVKQKIDSILISNEEENLVKAKIINKYPELFTDVQINWAKDIILGNSNYDNNKIPSGVIPNNDLLTKIRKTKGEEMNKGSRVLFVMYGWNESGGGTIFPKSVAIELSKRGWEVGVFYASTEYNNFDPPYSLKFHNEGEIKLYGLYNRPAPFIELENTEREIYDPKVVEIFKRVLNEFQPSVVHFHNLHGLTLALPKIVKEQGVPTLYTPHNYYMIDPKLYMYNSDLSLWSNTDFFANSELYRNYPEREKVFQRRQEFTKELLYRWFDVTLAVSRRQKDILLDFAPFTENVIVVHQVSPIVDKLWQSENLQFESYRAITSKIRVGYIGGVMPQKGVHLLAKAAQHFLPSDVEFRIYGFVPIDYLHQLQLIDNRRMLQFTGEYDLADLERIAGEIDIAVVPSLWEDCAPLVLAEANAMRLPVVASNIGGIPDFVVNGVNGLLYDFDSVDDLVSAIRYLSLNTNIVEEMRRNLAPYHFFADYVSHIERLYRAILQVGTFNSKDWELIITPKIAQMKRSTNIHFVSHLEVPETLSQLINSFGMELMNIQHIDETNTSYTFRIDVKVPKSVSLEDFFEQTVSNFSPVSEPMEVVTDEKASFEVEDFFAITGFEKETEKPMNSKEIEEVKFSSNLQEVTESITSEKVSEPELNVVWEGSQFVYHSLALINREQCYNLIQSKVVEVTIVPYEPEQFLPNGNPKYEALAQYDIRTKETPPEHIRKLPYLWIRHQWPPKADPPKGAKWVIMQPWEFSSLSKRFLEIFLQADELWVPSNFTRRAFVNSGIPFEKVQIVPNGIDPELFQPSGEAYPLKTNKKLKFLFVGGTTYRKGIDILLQAYVSNFTAKDDVVLVIKDMGTESFYLGQTAQDRINLIQNTEGAPEIIYIKEYLTEKEMASLYRACDVFISPYRGEGFSLPTLEAMASGLPVIVTEGGATEDFVLQEFGWKIPSYQISIGEYIDNDPLVSEAFLFEPDVNYLGSLMRSIYQNPGDIVSRGILASSYARKNWNWNRSTLKVLARIDALYGKNLAVKAMERLIDKIDSQILLGEAEEYFAKGDLTRAKSTFTQVLNSINELTLKHQIFLLLRLAIVEFLEDRFESCLNYLNKLEKIYSSHIDKIYLEAKIELKKNDLITALEKYTDLVSRWNQNRFDSMSGYSLDFLLTDMGKIFLEFGDSENSLQLFIEALKLNPNNIEARIGSAHCFILIKDFEEAKRMLRWVLENEPDNNEAKELMSSLPESIQN